MAKAFGGLEFEVEGFSQLGKALKKTELGKEVRSALKESAQHIVDDAVNRLHQAAGVAQKSDGLFKASATQRGANVRMVPGTRFPWAWGLEYGSKQYKQFAEWKGNQWESWGDGPGYFLTPAVRDKKQEAVDLLMSRMDAIFNSLPDASQVTR